MNELSLDLQNEILATTFAISRKDYNRVTKEFKERMNSFRNTKIDLEQIINSVLVLGYSHIPTAIHKIADTRKRQSQAFKTASNMYSEVHSFLINSIDGAGPEIVDDVVNKLHDLYSWCNKQCYVKPTNMVVPKLTDQPFQSN